MSWNFNYKPFLKTNLKQQFALNLYYSVAMSIFVTLHTLTDKLLRLPRGHLLCPKSPSGQMNYLSPPSIRGAEIMRHGNREFNTVAQAST